MANLKNVNLMSQGTFESIEQADDELYAVSGSGIGFPSSRFDELTLGASGTEYTAPANGWFYLKKQSNGNNQNLSLQAGTMQVDSYTPSSGGYCGLYIPVKKGIPCYVVYSLGGATTAFRFIYAEGE